tara:strand:- start:796 stop:1143 length:348 start_codon:yes stop_codon:yes gene_type:complete
MNKKKITQTRFFNSSKEHNMNDKLFEIALVLVCTSKAHIPFLPDHDTLCNQLRFLVCRAWHRCNQQRTDQFTLVLENIEFIRHDCEWKLLLGTVYALLDMQNTMAEECFKDHHRT